jgi:hypothetical protein
VNHSAAEIIATLLVNAGKAVFDQNLATASKWKVFVHVVPDDPPKLITTYDTMGIKDGRLMETGVTVIHPGWQIMVRGLYPATTYRVAQIIWDFTDTVSGLVLTIPARTVDDMLIPQTTYKVCGLFKTSPIMNAGQDEKRRFLFTLNGTTTIEQQ